MGVTVLSIPPISFNHVSPGFLAAFRKRTVSFPRIICHIQIQRQCLLKASTVEPLPTDTSIIRTPLYYGQSTWSERDQILYKLYLFNTDTSIIRTLSFVLSVSVLKRFDCTCNIRDNNLKPLGLIRTDNSGILKRCGHVSFPQGA